MKFKISEDKEQVAFVRAALKENHGYCPCVIDSENKPEYKCPCKNFKEEVGAGETCHCGLYVKVKQ